MDIHNVENLIVKGNDIANGKLIFFDKLLESDYNQIYVNLIINSPIITSTEILQRWVFTDANGIDYKVKKTALDVIEKGGTKIGTVKEDKITKFMMRPFIRRFLNNNGFDIDTEITEHFMKNEIISKYKFYETDYEYIRTLWNIRDSFDSLENHCMAIIVIDNDIVARVYCTIFTDSEAEDYFIDNNIMYPRMKLYIARVDTRLDFQGQGLCKPLLSYMIKHLRRLGYEMLFIDNASNTAVVKGEEGIPACICYYRAGINNNYRMRYYNRITDTFDNMDETVCFQKPQPDQYYYISDNIFKRGKDKLQESTKMQRYNESIR